MSDNITGVSLVSASIPRMFSNIYTGINVIYYTADGVDFIFTVAPGQYTAEELAAVLDTAAAFVVTYDSSQHRFLFSYTGFGVCTISSTSPLGPYIGVSEDITILSTPTPLQEYPQLQGPSQVFIESNVLASAHCVDSRNTGATSIPLYASVDFSAVPWGFVGRYDTATLDATRVEFPQEISLRHIDIVLTDAFGNILDLGPNVHSDLLFRLDIQ